MIEFAALLERLILTPGRNAKLTILKSYFAGTPDPDRGLALAVITRELEFKSVKAGAVRDMALNRIDQELFKLSYDYVGDLADTVSLAWPVRTGANRPPQLPEIVETLQTTRRKDAPLLLEKWMDALDVSGRWALIKMVTGGLRIGLSSRLAKQALADFGKVDISEIEEIWHGLTPPYEDLFAWLEGGAAKPAPNDRVLFRPMMLAHPLLAKKDRNNPDAIDPEVITPDTYAFEWKWDGVRVQAASDGDRRRLYSRTGDDISAAFPDIIEAMDFDAVLDGELLVRTLDGGVADFNTLQKRLNRKSASKKLLADNPAFIRAYDILRTGEEDLRELPFKDRRSRLERFAASLMSDRIDLSQFAPVSSFEALDALRNDPPTPEIEGLMLKRWDSPYISGRPKGKWFKFKRDPYLADAVLLYAQRGHGRRSGTYSDFTFGVWRSLEGEEQLTPIGKAYFGFTDEELKHINIFIKNNTRERFGPVTSVTANQSTGLVFEVAFDGVQRSTRHKSGIALRFPRINRIRWDKPPSEADRLETIASLIS